MDKGSSKVKPSNWEDDKYVEARQNPIEDKICDIPD